METLSFSDPPLRKISYKMGYSTLKTGTIIVIVDFFILVNDYL